MTESADARASDARAFADRLAARAADDLESIVYSPYPFSGGQLLVACKDRVRYLHEVAAVAAPLDPPKIPTHWLRLSELGSLCWPQGVSFIFMWGVTGGYPGWPYWLRNRGSILWGKDVCGLVPLPADPKRLLRAVLWGSHGYNRQHLFLRFLAEDRHAELLGMLAGLARRLMATALLVHGEWDVDEETIFDRFSRTFGTGEDARLCRELSAVVDGGHAPDMGGAASAGLERSAREAVWLVESLARMLGRCAR